GIEDAEGMREADLAGDVDVRPLAPSPHRADKVAETIDGEERRFVKRRNEEGGGKVRAVVLDVVEGRAERLYAELLADLLFHAGHLQAVPQAAPDRAEGGARGDDELR